MNPPRVRGGLLTQSLSEVKAMAKKMAEHLLGQFNREVMSASALSHAFNYVHVLIPSRSGPRVLRIAANELGGAGLTGLLTTLLGFISFWLPQFVNPEHE